MYDTDHEINQSVSCMVRVRDCSDFPFSFLKERRWLCMTAAFVNRSGEEKIVSFRTVGKHGAVVL